jgi:hypothetical protein
VAFLKLEALLEKVIKRSETVRYVDQQSETFAKSRLLFKIERSTVNKSDIFAFKLIFTIITVLPELVGADITTFLFV